jgi:hypothetical protein
MPLGEATARASSGVTAPGLSRRSTTTISLPMPFILANVWLASVLMDIPTGLSRYMASNRGLASAADPKSLLPQLAQCGESVSVASAEREGP